MIQIRFELNGKDVSAEEFGAELEQAARANIREQIVLVVEDVRCPEHGESVRSITFQGSAKETLKFEVECCCDALREAVREAFEYVPGRVCGRVSRRRQVCHAHWQKRGRSGTGRLLPS